LCFHVCCKTVQEVQGRIQGRFVGFGRTPPPKKKTDAPGNQRYEMIVDNKLKLFRKLYEQRRARRYEKEVSFLPARDAIASAGITYRIAVCPSVRLSQVGVL